MLADCKGNLNVKIEKMIQYPILAYILVFTDKNNNGNKKCNISQ